MFKKLQYRNDKFEVIIGTFLFIFNMYIYIYINCIIIYTYII